MKGVSDALRGSAKALAREEADGLLRSSAPSPALLAGLEGESQAIEAFAGRLGRLLGEAMSAAPRRTGRGVLELTVPLITFVRDPAGFIARLVEGCLSFGSVNSSTPRPVRRGAADIASPSSRPSLPANASMA
jgi:hypothetical protein